MSDESNRWIEQEIDAFFNGQTTITKEELKKALEEHRMGRRRGMDRSGPIQDDMKQKLSQLLESELNKINSNTITREQAKSVLSSFGRQAKEQWRAQMDQHLQSSIKNELAKLDVSEINASQARDLLHNVSHQMRPPHGGGSSMIDDNMKNEFLTEFKSKHGTNKIGVDEVWELMKSFDKKQHEKMDCCERNSDWEKIFNEQYKELFGDVEKTKVNQQQLEQLAKSIKEKLRADSSQHPGKRFCQH